MQPLRLPALPILLAILSALPNAQAQDFPNRPIRLFTSAAGGNSDAVARHLAQAMSGPLGQPVLVENRAPIQLPPIVQKEKPDGHTIMLSGDSVWVRPLLTPMPYDALKDFSFVTIVSRVINLIVVNPSLPVSSVKELIALAKTRPGALHFGATGVGGGNHLAGELFKSMAGVDIVAVQYKGAAPALTAVVGGEVQMGIYDLGLVAPMIKAGKIRALAVATLDASELVPGMPTVSASGLPGYESVSITGIFAPARTPAAIIQRLNTEFVRALRSEESRQRFLASGTEVVGSSPEQFEAAVKTDTARWVKVIREANIKLE